MIGLSPKAGVAEHGNSDDRSLDVVFDLLADQRRRYTLACLEDHSRTIALADLAEEVAVRENEEPIAEIPKEEIMTIRTSLYHNHVPRLADAGVVEYDSDCDSVRMSETAHATPFTDLLAAAGGEER